MRETTNSIKTQANKFAIIIIDVTKLVPKNYSYTSLTDPRSKRKTITNQGNMFTSLGYEPVETKNVNTITS